jgi:hypothetical protein
VISRFAARPYFSDDDSRPARQGLTMRFFGRKKRLTDYASCAG